MKHSKQASPIRPRQGHDPHGMSGRKPGAHRPRDQKRAKDKLRKEVEAYTG